MRQFFSLWRLDRADLAQAQRLVTERHYLHAPVDARCSVEGYAAFMCNEPVAFLLLGRPQATRCFPWYGSVEDLAIGRAEVTRWQVLNLARVWIDPRIQVGGSWYEPDYLPGFIDRKGTWRSTFGSLLLERLADCVPFDYLASRPPCFLDEPYELRWLISYCDTRVHRGTLYRASGFELYRTNEDGVQTWRRRLRPLTAQEDREVRFEAQRNARSIEHRFRRAQLPLPLTTPEAAA